jgi:hypothetical protein
VRIRTKEELVDFLDEELSWRRKELSTLKGNVDSSRPKLQPTAIRAAIVLLYAHWEGFIKQAAEAYLAYVVARRLKHKDLSLNFVAVSLRQKLHEFGDTNKATLHNQFVEHVFTCGNETAILNRDRVIRTGDNLKSSILQEILAAIGLDFSPYDTKSNLIDEQLLKYRNNIAHGKNLPVDAKEYESLHAEVQKMLESIKSDIETAALTSKYRR